MVACSEHGKESLDSLSGGETLSALYYWNFFPELSWLVKLGKSSSKVNRIVTCEYETERRFTTKKRKCYYC